jgi:tRNA(Phe) wybutosine-synthesizing methylase Tyw3
MELTIDEKLNEFICQRFENIYIYDENYELIEMYLKLFPQLINYDEGHCVTLAACKGRVDLLKLYVSYCAKFLTSNNRGLYACSSRKHYDALVYVLSLGEDIENIKHTNGYQKSVEYLKSINYFTNSVTTSS